MEKIKLTELQFNQLISDQEIINGLRDKIRLFELNQSRTVELICEFNKKKYSKNIEFNIENKELILNPKNE